MPHPRRRRQDAGARGRFGVRTVESPEPCLSERLKELLEDYRDFMREHHIEEWTPDHSYAQRLRQLNRTPGANYETFKKASSIPIRAFVPTSLWA